MLSLTRHLHFLVVTDTVSEDVDLQEKHGWMVRPGRTLHAGARVGVKVHH